MAWVMSNSEVTESTTPRAAVTAKSALKFSITPDNLSGTLSP